MMTDSTFWRRAPVLALLAFGGGASAQPAPSSAAPACSDAAGCLAACDRNEALGCWYAAGLVHQGTGVPADRPKAFALATRACDLGYAEACGMAMQLLDQGDGATPDPARSLAYGDRACDAGVGVACFNVGLKYLGGKGAALDTARALDRFLRGCDHGGPAGACAKAAEILERADGVPHDPKRAAELYDKACRGDSPTSCTNLGRLKLPTDPTAAVALFEKACAAREPFGCQARGESLEVVDPVGAAGWYSRACNEGHAPGCAAMARLVRQGRAGYGPDEAGQKATAQLFETACNQGDVASCLDFGALLLDGRGVPADPARALKIGHDACAGGAPVGCHLEGVILFKGAAGKADPARAKKLLAQACDAHVGAACNDLAGVLQQDPQTCGQAPALYERGCGGGVSQACVSQAVLLIQGGCVGADVPRGVGILRKTCDAKDGNACNQLGMALLTGYAPLVRDPVGAAAAFQRGCALNDGQACGAAGAMLYDGATGKPDPAAARPLLEKGCAVESVWACARLAQMYRGGEGGLARDPGKADALLNALCDGDKGQQPDRRELCTQRRREGFQKALDLFKPPAKP
jgi:TPR repeat protein